MLARTHLLTERRGGAPECDSRLRLLGFWPEQPGSEIRLSPEEIPRFEAQLIPARVGLLSAADDVLLLLLWVTVAFLAAFVSFLRCDVR